MDKLAQLQDNTFVISIADPCQLAPVTGENAPTFASWKRNGEHSPVKMVSQQTDYQVPALCIAWHGYTDGIEHLVATTTVIEQGSLSSCDRIESSEREPWREAIR